MVGIVVGINGIIVVDVVLLDIIVEKVLASSSEWAGKLSESLRLMGTIDDVRSDIVALGAILNVGPVA